MFRLNQAIKLRASGKAEEAIVLLKELILEYPDDADINYELAWCYDLLGLEKAAIPYYEKAIAMGLPEKDQIEAIIGLGSTYRTVGLYEKSKELLEEGIKKYDNQAMKVFLSMTLYNLTEHEEAMSILLKLLSETSSDHAIMQFKKAINYYSDKLNEKW